MGEAPAHAGDLALVAAIVGGDEAAFLALVEANHAGFLRLARMWLRDDALAEEAVQETWLAALEQLDRYEGRSSLKTWLCAILHNLARKRLHKEQRTTPLSALATDEEEPAVDPSRFSPPGHRWEGHWSQPPVPWTPEQALLTAELRTHLESAIARLPLAQREVIVLCDIEGLTGEEACNILGLTGTNQRVLLHRARSKLRAMLEALYHEGVS